ncbi:hypothetical protein IJ096_01430 [Candidatus Saccharibacteria bacterium]|nr:hypothetical protein [Candidatus Saccharibacteria bacterium]
MNNGFVKRKIEVENFDEDIFSDEIRTGAIIEEIEAAETAARQAKIEKEIEAGQPSVVQRLKMKAFHRGNKIKEQVRNAKEDLTTKVPEDPRVERTTLRDRITDGGAWISRLNNNVKDVLDKQKEARRLEKKEIEETRREEKVIEKAEREKKEKSVKPERPIIDPAKAVRKKRGFKGMIKHGFDKINSLVPEGVAMKTVVESAIVAALIVIAGEIWAWNLSHPLFQGQSVENVPVTGTPAEGSQGDDKSTEKPDDGAFTPPSETKIEEKKVEEETKQNDGNTGHNLGSGQYAGDGGYSGYGGNYTAGGYYAGSSAVENGEGDSSNNTAGGGNAPEASSQPRNLDETIHVDSRWSDAEDNWWTENTDGGETEDEPAPSSDAEATE